MRYEDKITTILRPLQQKKKSHIQSITDILTYKISRISQQNQNNYDSICFGYDVKNQVERFCVDKSKQSG